MVGSKCRDFKNREVSNVNAPTHEKCICSKETNSSLLIPDFILLHYIDERGLSGSNGQADNSKILTITSDLP